MRNAFLSALFGLVSTCSVANELVVVDGIELQPVVEHQSQSIRNVELGKSLRYSGNVSVKAELSGMDFINTDSGLLISMRIVADVQGPEADYTQELEYSTNVEPYYDFKSKAFGFYPVGVQSLREVNEDPLIGGDIDNETYRQLKLKITDTVKSNYINGLSHTELDSVRHHIDVLDFLSVQDSEDHTYLQVVLNN